MVLRGIFDFSRLAVKSNRGFMYYHLLGQFRPDRHKTDKQALRRESGSDSLIRVMFDDEPSVVCHADEHD